MSYSGARPLPIANGGTGQTTAPSFLVYISSDATNATGDGTNYLVALDTKVYDTTSSFNTGTFLYTVPVTGAYMLSTQVYLTGVDSITGMTSCVTILNVTGGSTYNLCDVESTTADGSHNLSLNGSVIAQLTSGATIGLHTAIFNGTKTATVVATSGSPLVWFTWFAGYLIT